MAPRRHHLPPSSQLSLLGGGGGGTTPTEVYLDELLNSPPPGMTRCCVPTGDCLRAQQQSPQMILSGGGGDAMLISLDDLRDTIRVTCSNDICPVGRYMHRECFDHWEQTLLTYLKTCGRARSWSERQRHQNLWTKKGYDLAYKACGCRCGGYLKKDLDWMPPPPTSNIFGRVDDLTALINAATIIPMNGGGNGNTDQQQQKKKKRRNRNSRPALTLNSTTPMYPSYNNNNNSYNQTSSPNFDLGRGRAGSLSSSTGSSSPPTSSSGTSSGAASSSEPSISPIHAHSRKKSAILEFPDRLRVAGGANGIFTRRLDFSSFNALPKIKLNSYQIKTEDEGNHGNDDTRCFILSTLASQKRSRVQCVLCDDMLPVFDRYPLVDGTFFLSPRQHAADCIEVKVEGRTQYLSVVCMGCLEGVPGKVILCIFCKQKWDGSSLVLGTMYSYDIFAAMSCCTDRMRCNKCHEPVLPLVQRLHFFSDYSHMLTCQYCNAVDTHFVKPLRYIYIRQPPAMLAQQFWP